jgi:ketosteroid isomerase-like protein
VNVNDQHGERDLISERRGAKRLAGLEFDAGGIEPDASRMSELTERVANEVAVLEANRDFYQAFSDGDFDAMNRLWAERAPVACMHPGLPAIVGRAAVLGSWKRILEDVEGWEMSCRGARVHVLGGAAFVTCFEASGDRPAHLAATNVFVLEDGRWRMVHHQAGTLSEPIPTSSSPEAAN